MTPHLRAVVLAHLATQPEPQRASQVADALVATLTRPEVYTTLLELADTKRATRVATGSGFVYAVAPAPTEWRWHVDPRAERAAERAWHAAFERGASDTACTRAAQDAAREALA